MSAKRRRTAEDKDIAQELFLDSSSEDEIMSHDNNGESDNDSNQDESQQDNAEWRENTVWMWCMCNPKLSHRDF
jgi:hypothetical protein